MNATTVTIISLSCTILGLIIGYLGFSRSRRNDQTEEGVSKGMLASDLGYVKAGVDDLKREMREDRKNASETDRRLARCEESCKQAHKRIDKIEEIKND